MREPASFILMERYGRDPFILLISCILSLRTKDDVTLVASFRLFDQARDPESVGALDQQQLESLIYPVGFYRQKTRQIKEICSLLLENYQGCVPRTKEQLLSLSGVGIKTANLVLGMAFQIPALCVDTHVHRIANRLGLVTTATPEDTERELTKVIPEKYWIEISRLLVMWGQNVCVPISPRCSTCVLASICPRKGVISSR